MSQAFELVDSILEAVHADADPSPSYALTMDCVRQAVADSKTRIIAWATAGE